MTTIGLGVFHFWVRNGIRWDNSSIIATSAFKIIKFKITKICISDQIRPWRNCDGPWAKKLAKGRNLRCESNTLKFWVYRRIKWFISTPRLNTLLCLHLEPINPVICGKSKSSHLGVSFALICFQRLSIPDLATQRCSWRNNWYTRGQFIPVLSY